MAGLVRGSISEISAAHCAPAVRRSPSVRACRTMIEELLVLALERSIRLHEGVEFGELVRDVLGRSKSTAQLPVIAYQHVR